MTIKDIHSLTITKVHSFSIVIFDEIINFKSIFWYINTIFAQIL